MNNFLEAGKPDLSLTLRLTRCKCGSGDGPWIHRGSKTGQSRHQKLASGSGSRRACPGHEWARIATSKTQGQGKGRRKAVVVDIQCRPEKAAVRAALWLMSAASPSCPLLFRETLVQGDAAFYPDPHLRPPPSSCLPGSAPGYRP